MRLANWFRSKIIRLIHWAMEVCRRDPETTSDDWREIKRLYKATVGREYDRNNTTWSKNDN
jgi:hypothetical protein